jgi:hypothetical protein
MSASDLKSREMAADCFIVHPKGDLIESDPPARARAFDLSRSASFPIVDYDNTPHNVRLGLADGHIFALAARQMRQYREYRHLVESSARKRRVVGTISV